MKLTRVVMVIENNFVRRAIRSILDAESSIAVVGEVCPCLVEPDLIASLQPDVILIDLDHPCGSAIKAIVTIKRLAPRIRIIASVICHPEDEIVAAGAAAGADQILLRGDDDLALLQAIDDIRSGGAILTKT